MSKKNINKTTIILLVLISAIICITPFMTVDFVHAEQVSCMQVQADGVYLFEDPELTKKLFEIPKTYFVTKMDEGKFKYKDAEGYIKDTKNLAGPYRKNTVTPTPITFNNYDNTAVFKQNGDKDPQIFYFDSEKNKEGYTSIKRIKSIKYLGKNGDLQCFMLTGTTLGDDPLKNDIIYITEDKLNTITLSEHTFKPKETTEAVKPKNEKPVNYVIKITLIVVITLLSIAIVILIFKPTKRKTDMYLD